MEEGILRPQHKRESKLLLCTLVLVFLTWIVISIHSLEAPKQMCLCSSPNSTHIQVHDITSLKPIPKKFLYLIQVSKGLNEATFGQIPRDEADVDFLTYSYIDPKSSVYYPGSSWTSGRNMLYYNARLKETRQGWNYTYYIFADGDVMFSKEMDMTSQFRNWHGFLSEWEPALASPIYHDKPPKLAHHVFTYGLLDGMFNAFHRETFGILVPYVTHFDSRSWWGSQAILGTRANLFYRGHILMYSGISGHNSAHTSYPQEDPLISKEYLEYAISIPQCNNSTRSQIRCYPPVNEVYLTPRKKDFDYSKPKCGSYMEITELLTNEHGAYKFGNFCPEKSK